MLEEPNEDRVVPPESIGEEEQRTREDQDEPESEEEHWSSVLFTQEQLEILFKMNRPDFSELVTALKGGASIHNLLVAGTIEVPRFGWLEPRILMLGLQKWRIICMPPRLDDIRPWSLLSPT